MHLQEARYSTLQMASHWALAVLCVVEFPTAFAIVRAHLGHAFGIKASPFDLFLANIHEWAGWAILLLTVLLLLDRFVRGAPKLPSGMSLWQRTIAHGAHAAIYLCLFALVASGAVAMYLSAKLALFHITLTKVGIGLISLHLAGVVWHQLVRRDGLLKRLMPTRRLPR
ncbi:cytochrome b [Rhodopirellula bahusiensis]|uniref:cytochrome b n=1 Tax=Pseudomonadati TaxID=3379134 RepID=UPI003D649719